MENAYLSADSLPGNVGWNFNKRDTRSRISQYFSNYNIIKYPLVALLFCVFYLPFMADAQYSNVPVTGFNADVVAEGTGGPATNFTTADVDGVNYVFVSTTFNPATSGSPCTTTTSAMPASGTIASLTTTGLTYSLQPYTGNNVLRLPLGTPGTLTLTTPTSAANLYLLALGGSGLCNITATVNFTDLTSQTITATVADWCSGTSPATTVFYRIINTSTTCNGGTCQYLYDVNLALSPANYLKSVASISLVTTAPSGILNVFAVGAKAPCAVPTAQPTALLSGAITSGSISASFTAATTVPTGGYLVVRYPQGAATTAPANGTTYTAGQTIGLGTVISSAAPTTTSFTSGGLTSNTGYDFYVYSYNTGTTCGGPMYMTTTPLTATFTTSTCGTVPGTIPIGSGLPNTTAGGFTSISNAIAALGSNGISGNVILELQPSYDGSQTNETYPITFSYNACITSTKTVTIRPAASVSSSLTIGSDSLQTINMNGGSYITFDGRPGGTGTTSMLKILNTKSNGTGVAIQFINDAHHNTFRYCDIQGQNTSATSTAACGVIYFGSTNTLALAGNDLNTIANCDIHATINDFPAIAICSYGLATAAPTTNWNDSNTITNCNIYDFYSAAQPTTAIKLDGGSNAFTISNNKIYQTATRNYTTSNQHRAFWLTPSATGACGFQVINNFIGGNGPTGAGTWTLTSGASVLTNFWAMDINHAGLGRTSVQGNTITNISLSSNTSTANDLFRGISTGSTGNVDIGNITGNIIGSGTGTGAIQLNTTATGSTSYAIKVGSTTDTINVYNNTIGSITLSSATAANALNFHGISVTGSVYANIINNTVGSLTTPLSINSVDSATNVQSVHGISASLGIYVTISNNKIANLNNNYKSTSTGYTRGIYLTSSTTSVISGNSVRNISSASSYTGTGINSALIGIQMSSSNPSTVTGNIVDSLVLTSPSTGIASMIEGIYFASNGAVPVNLVTKNFVHSLDVLAANTSALMIGIEIAGGANIIANNMIRVGVKPDGTDMNTAMIIRGLYINTSTPENIYHNSVYIGGTGVGTNAANTAAFFRNASTAGNQHDVRNNIFVNDRSNATTGGKHYQIYLNNTTALTIGTNVYYGTGTGAVFGTQNGGTSDAAGYTLGWLTADVGSSTSNPRFLNATGAASAVNLHISPSLATPVESTGFLVSGVTDDYDGQTRSTLSPVDIGADAGTFTALSMTIDSTVVDQNTNVIPRGSSNQYIVRIRMYAKENYSPLQVNSFALSTLGSTTATNITNAKVFSTGSSSTFSTGTQYGSTVAAPSGSFTVTGTASLSAGVNYFWVTYDISNTAVLNNVVDVRLTNIALSGSASPAILNGDPAGSRTIKLPLSGSYSVGTSGAYSTIAAAMADAGALGVSAPVIFNLTDATYTLTDSVFVGVIPGTSATNTVTLRPDATNALGATITSSATTTFEISGVNYFVIDGRPGGTTSPIAVPNTTNLNIVNTSLTGTALRFNNDARFNTVKYADLQGKNNISISTLPGTSSGVVFFGLTNGVNGNDKNTIDNCNIHSTTSTDTLTMGVYSAGPASSSDITGIFNDSNTVSNCNIYNMYGAVNLSTGGIVLDRGNNAWTITGNSFFSTVTRTPVLTAGVFNRGVYINTTNTTGIGNGFTITGNYFGGTAPLCGGTPYTSNSTGSFNNLHESIYLSSNGGTATNIKGNTFTNMNISQAASTADIYHAVWVNHNGNVNIGGPLPADGNIIGSTTTTGAITLSSTGGITPSHMILLSNGGSANASTNVLIQNNKIGGINLTGSGNSFTGIFVSPGSTVTIDNNLIGSTTVANSINANNTGTTAQFVRGINIPSSSAVLTITNNTIANLNNATTSTTTGSNGVNGSYPHTVGIFLIGTSNVGPIVTGNTVRALTCSASQTGVGTGAAVVGIGAYNISALSPATVSGNKVDSLISTSTGTVAIAPVGITYSGPTSVTNTIAKNYVDNIDLTAVNTSALIKGIEIMAGNANVVNNMVRLGVHGDGTALTTAVTASGILKSSSGNVKLYHNSVYIGGTGVGTASVNSAAFRRTTTGVDEVRNNIFVNNRSNATTGGKHYQVVLNAPATVLMNNNIYFGNGTGAVFGTANGTVDTLLYKAGWIANDANSIVGDPQFINVATATSSTNNLHINATAPTPVEASGAPIALVTDDYDGQVRSSNTPVDIGADAGNFVQADLVGPTIGAVVATNTSLTTNRTISVNISDNSGVATAGNAPKIYYYKSSGGVAGSYATSTATLASGTALNGVWNFSIVSANMGGLVLGDSVYYYISAQDVSAGTYYSSSPVGATNSGSTPPPTLYSYKIVNGYSGNINVGTGQTFTTLTATGGIFDSINKGSLSGDVTLTVTSDLLNEDGTVALTQWAESGAGNYKVTIVPNSATERLIVGSVSTAGSGLIRFDGADRVKIDGRFAGSGRYLRFRNRAQTGTTFMFINDAQRDTLTYCTIEGTNNTSGVISFGTTALTTGTGNDMNGINNCIIGDTLGSVAISNRPSTIISSIGTTNYENSDNSIVNNNMYNFTGNGINITTGNGDNWTITGNSLYNNMQTPSAIGQAVIQFIPGLTSVNNRISGNYIGGAAPLCAGAAYVVTGSVGWRGMIVTTGIADSTYIQNNTIQNINISGTSTGTLTAIEVLGGMVSVNGNTIGHNTTANSIQTPMFGNVIGIMINATNISTQIYNNTIANITSTGNSTAANICGIRISSANTLAAMNIRNNTIKSLSSVSATTSTATPATSGIMTTFAGVQHNISGNNISLLSNSGAGGTVFGIGISNTAATGIIASNMVYGLTSTSNNNTSHVAGIHLDAAYNMAIVNNMVSLGYNIDSSTLVSGIVDKSSGTINPVYYNSVRISGVALSSQSTVSQAYRRTTTSGTSVRNNIFNNSRTGGTGNYAVANTSTTPGTGWVANNNIFSSANAAQIGLWSFNSLTLAAWKSTSLFDTNSVSYSVNFISNTDLHLTTGSIGNSIMAGKPISGYTTDIDGATRNAIFPYIGADENAAPVPVKLILFTANSSNGSDVQVSWRTASEINNRGFEVLRSVDGKQFEVIGFVKGKGNTSLVTNYSLADNKAFETVKANTIYYRLKQLDVDGTETLSNTVSVNRESKLSKTLVVSPNPFNTDMTISLEAAAADQATIQVMDIQGKVVARFSTTILKGFNSIHMDEVSGLNSGVYFVKLTTTNETFVTKVVKQ
jgi:hypothetical protein